MAQAPARCLAHPERTAVARCKQCHKPLCPKCVQKMPGGVYCSKECYENAAQFKDRVEKLDQQRKSGSGLGTLLVRLTGLAIVAGILYYVFVLKGVRSIDGLVQVVKGLLS